MHRSTPVTLGGASARDNIASLGRFMRPLLGLGRKYWPEIKKVASTLIQLGGNLLSENHIKNAIKEPATDSQVPLAIEPSSENVVDTISETKNRRIYNNKVVKRNNTSSRKRKKSSAPKTKQNKTKRAVGGKRAKKRKVKLVTIFD